MNETLRKSLAEYDALRGGKQSAYNAGILSERAYVEFLLEEDTLFKILKKNGAGNNNRCAQVKFKD